MRRAENISSFLYGCVKPAIVVGYRNYSWLTVCLDNGHGEETPGKRSPYAQDPSQLPALYLREYAWNREMVSLIKEELKKYGVDVFVVVPETKDIGLSERARRANDYKKSHPSQKCLFISVHVNAGASFGWGKAKGWSAYTTKGETNSDKLAASLYKAAEECLDSGRKIRRQSNIKPDFEENFTVIYKADMPAVLTENFFMDNEDDVRYILSDKGKREIARLHVKGILDFADKIWRS